MLPDREKRFLDTLLFSNIFIALCAMAQGALTYLLLRQPINIFVVSLLGAATLFLYNFSMVLSRPGTPSSSRRSNWIYTHFGLIQAITLISALTLIPFALNLSMPALGFLSLTGLLAISYGLPIFKGKSRPHGLRGLPGAKLFLIALVWTFSCVCLPIIELRSEGVMISNLDSTLLAAKRFLFITAITIPFDIRDLFQDKQYQLKTIPVMLGPQNASRVCLLLMAAHILLLIIFVDRIDLPAVGLIAVTSLAAWLVFKSSWEKNEYYYFLWLDGTLILQFLSVALLRLL